MIFNETLLVYLEEGKQSFPKPLHFPGQELRPEQEEFGGETAQMFGLKIFPSFHFFLWGISSEGAVAFETRVVPES